MQGRERRSNRERAEATRASLLGAARELFVSKGYAATGSPELVASAGLTRGALYHHYANKLALFAAVIEAESEVVAREIESAGSGSNELDALLLGGDAYLTAMTVHGRARLLLIEAPAILGSEAVERLEERHAERTLREGLGAAMGAGRIQPLPLVPLTRCLSAAYDRAALAIDRGADANDERAVLRALICGLQIGDAS